MKLPFDTSDLLVIAVVIVTVGIAIFATDAPSPAVSATARFVADCPAPTQYEIWHVGPRRSMQITCEGIAR